MIPRITTRESERQHLRSVPRFCMIGTLATSKHGHTMGLLSSGGRMPDGDGPRVGFLGAGRMATALASGWLRAGLVNAEHVVASDPLPQAREAFAAETRLRTTADNREVVRTSDLLILAVKPQSMKGLLTEVRPFVTDKHLVVSIAAGITLRQLAEGLGSERR